MAILTLLCLFAPFPLWLVEIILPYPYIIEEIFKFFVVLHTPKKNPWYLPLILGLVFSFSETVLYLINFFALGNFSNLPLRLITTTFLHVSTFFLMYFFKNNRLLLFLSLFLAIFIHFIYNNLV